MIFHSFSRIKYLRRAEYRILGEKSWISVELIKDLRRAEYRILREKSWISVEAII